MTEVRSPLQGTVVRIAGVGDPVAPGGEVAVIESMKMEHVVEAGGAGVVASVVAGVGDQVQKGEVLAVLDLSAAGAAAPADAPVVAATAGSAPTWRPSASGTPSAWTTLGPRRSPGGARPGTAPPGRTSTTSSIRAASWSTARW